MKGDPFEPVGEKKYDVLEVEKQKKSHIAIGMVMLLIFVSMMAYMISTVEENNMATNEEMVTELGNWDTYYVESADGLPVCIFPIHPFNAIIITTIKIINPIAVQPLGKNKKGSFNQSVSSLELYFIKLSLIFSSEYGTCNPLLS